MNIKSKEIKLVNINDIQPNNKNRNHHPEDQIDRLVEIIKYQGFRSPLIISNRSGLLVSGHGRLLAARKLGLVKLPVIYQDFDSEEQEYAAGISENAIASWAELDLAGINFDLQDLGPDFDLDLFGIKDFHLDVAEKLEPGCDEDETPELPKDSKVKRGDIFILGSHRLMCGDSTMIDDVEKLMAGEKADMVFTDPPYGMFLDTDYTKMPISPTGAKPKSWDKVAGDNDDFRPELIQTLLGVFDYCSEIFLFGADYYSELLTNKNNGSWYVWDKRVTENFDKMIGSAFELCWSKKKHKREIARINNTLYSGESDAINKVHPTQKPIKLIDWFFERIKGTIVVDLFGGSGSTLIACEKTNRKCYMMELDEHYCSVILDRWQKYSGKKATHVNGTSWDDIKNSV